MGFMSATYLETTDEWYFSIYQHSLLDITTAYLTPSDPILRGSRLPQYSHLCVHSRLPVPPLMSGSTQTQ